MTGSFLRWTRQHLRGHLVQAVGLLSWTVVHLTLLLVAIAVVVAVTSGWSPVVVTGGSMAPSVRVGDVLFVEEPTDELIGQQSVITYDDRERGELVTHRVFEVDVENGTYTTKGDANVEPDSGPIHHSDVVGVGRLLIPFLGLPIVWWQTGDVGALAGLAVLATAALAASIASASRQRRARSDGTDRFSAAALRGIGRARLVVAVMITAQFFVDGRQFALDAIGLTRFQTLLFSLAGLGAVSLIAGLRSTVADDDRRVRRLATAELVGDTLVVVFFVTASSSSDIGWILMALPIIEAAVHFRLTGAFVHWMLMCGLSVAAFFWTRAAAGVAASTVIDEFEQLVDRLGVLLLVVIPGSYLAEQLLGDVLTQRRATRIARERSRMMERVTEAGHDVTRLGSELFETLTGSARTLGFESADAWIGGTSSPWRLLAADRDEDMVMPHPGSPGSAMQPDDLALDEVGIDGNDPDPAEVAAIDAAGIGTLIRITLATEHGKSVVFRAATRRLLDDPGSQIMALRLLCDQAAVALQNEQLLDELQTAHDELEQASLHDPLTGLPNRTNFVGRLREGLDDTHPRPLPGAILFLDLNGFKAVNDRLGHLAGDSLLAGVAARFVAAVDGRGMVARLGGDEFTVLVDGPDGMQTALEIADAIHLALVEPFDLRDGAGRVGASIGIAPVEAGRGHSELLRRADVAMYAAKGSAGSWRTAVYDGALDEADRQRNRLAEAFRASLESDELRLAYQPVVDASTGRIVGVEALLRWSHREVGAVGAATIVEIAEATGSVDELSAWVFRTALTDIASCSTDPYRDLFVAVNVSPRELELDTLVPNMERALAESGLAASRVVVELSERIVASARGSIDNVNRLMDLGLRLALDDFGEGQTSLAHLRGLPITHLKLDRLFIQNADESVEDRKILASVVGLAHDLGFSVIAEGIETPAHHQIVAAAGADLLQGYGLHAPMTIAEFRRTLDSVAPFPPGWLDHAEVRRNVGGHVVEVR